MKLSEIKGDRSIDVIADIIDPIANIAESDEVKSIFAKVAPPNGVDAVAFAKKQFIKRAKAHVPALLKNHRSDIIAILAAIEGVSVDEYRKRMTLRKLIADTADLVTDDAFFDFFIQTGAVSGAASADGAGTA